VQRFEKSQRNDDQEEFDMGGDDFQGDDYNDDMAMPYDESFASFTDVNAGKTSMGGAEFAGAELDKSATADAPTTTAHTQQVLSMLKTNMPKGASASLSFDSLSAGCSRRTAAGVFFELLQLKTWDFVDVDQKEAYGDISVSRGVKFNEEVGASA